MKKYKVQVWYRYNVSDECEKDFDIHPLFARNKEEAVKIAKDIYKENRPGFIPFKFEIIK